jgi:FMN-dependent NADH-azoreductase
MTKILLIEASASKSNAITRTASEILINKLKSQFPDSTLVSHDLTTNPVPLVDETWLLEKGSNDEPNYLHDLIESDIVVISAPMYNFSIPASLKAFIDRIVVSGKTFKYENNEYLGLLSNDKKVYVLASSMGDWEQMKTYNINFYEPYLKHILSFIGLTDVNFIVFNQYKVKGESIKKEVIEQQIDSVLAK